MGIFDRFRHKAHDTVDPAQRAALAHDEAADAFSDEAVRTRPDAEERVQQTDQDRQAAQDMTAEGDPWD